MKKKHGSMPKIHTCSGPDSHNEQNTGTQSANTNGTPVLTPQQQRWPQDGRRCNLALAHADARGARTSTKSRGPGARMVTAIPSATGTSRAASTSAPTTGASAHRQIPTRILPDERRPRTVAKAGQPQNTNVALAARDVLGGPPVRTARQPPLRREGAPGAKPASPTC
jgi:hypothetical protein